MGGGGVFHQQPLGDTDFGPIFLKTQANRGQWHTFLLVRPDRQARPVASNLKKSNSYASQPLVRPELAN